ncbi:MAG: copper resistance system multicopper oxidase [Steroidobacteraceae bacterium]|nr:copper resistance system multicopper oxidase [Steroidobacteraceae bacterium]
MRSLHTRRAPLTVSRRRFVQGLAGGALLIGAGRRASWGAGPREPAVLSGTDFRLTIDELPVNFTGADRVATVVNGQVPGPLLRMRQGDTVTVRVTNRLPMRSSIHWHGLIVPADMDGVPGLSFPGIGPGETFTYRFKVNQHGTYWYHAHSRFQEQTGLYGPLVIDRLGGERHGFDREHVILLSDWTDRDPEHLFATLKRRSDSFNYGKRTLGDFLADVRRQGWQATGADRRMWGEMRMNPTDLADVSGAVYTYLMNGVTPTGNWTALFQRGERVRLRFINGSAMSIFDVRIPGLPLTVVAADGQDVEPVTVDEFRIGTAEVYDVIVQPHDDRAYTIFAQSMDRSGYARGTLAPRAGMEAEVPPLDPRPLLTMADMGHGTHGGGHNHSGASGHASVSSVPASDVAAGGAHAHSNEAAQADTASEHVHAHSPSASHVETSGATRHPPAEYGPTTDMLVSQPSSRLDDPGVGLRDNGRRVLTYADLRTLGGPIDRRAPGREIELHLTGHMQRFIWSFNGEKFSEAAPLRFTHGERLRIVLVNDSMMTHPIHLHGMWSEIESEDGAFQVRKHTVTVRPAQRISYLVTADALGRWAYHCHLLYHMEAGMFREVIVAHDHGGHGSHSGHGSHG